MAIPVDAETRTALQAPVKQLRSTITWVGTDMQPHTMTSEDRIISIKKEAEGYYFASALRKITITTSGTGTELMDQDVAITIQVKKADQTWGNLPWGTFHIEETTVSEDKGTTTYVGYGGVYKLQQREYIGGELNFPTTVGGLIKQVAEATGLIVNGGKEILPAEYQSIEYLEGTGTQYLQIYTVADGDKLTLDLDSQFTEATEASQTIAATTGATGSWYGQISSVWVHNAQEQNPIPSTTRLNLKIKFSDTEERRIIVINNTTGAKLYDLSASPINTGPLGLFASGHGRYFCKARVYSARLWRNGEESRSLIPCYRKSDNKPGLYDTVGGVFYTNAGTGEFIAGPETHWLPNADAPITEDLYARITGTTYRDILEEIAGATGTLAVIGGGDDTLDFNQPPIDAPTDTMTEDNLIKFKIGENWGKCSAVVLSRQPQGDNIEVVDATISEKYPKGRNWYDNEPTTGSIAGLTTTSEPDGWTLNGTTTKEGARQFFGVATLPPGTYTIRTEYVSGTFTRPGVSGAIPSCWLYIGTSWSRPFYDDIGVAQTTPVKTKTFTLTETTEVRLAIYAMNSTYTDFKMRATIASGSTALTEFEPFIPNGRVDLVITNNEILDDQRETTATPILDAVKGWEYREATLKTEGHGYHEIGDRIDVTIGGQTFPTVITKSVIIVDGGINETLTSTTPTKTSIDYSKTGGITKTIYNTELAVDKQGQEIVGIVSRQDQQDETIAENYTRIIQNINSIVQTVQVSGGGNLIKNSVGFGKNSDGTLTIWQYGAGADTTTVRSQSSTASLNAGGISGHEIDVNGATISQTVQLTAGELYNLSCRVQKQATGTATITINDGVQTTTLTAQASTAYEWNQLNADFTPQTGSVTITITTTEGWTSITDLMLAQGGITGWRQASGEIYNLQVSVDQDGVQVKSATYAGDYVQITPLEFAGYSNAGGAMKKVFTVNRDTTEVAKLQAESMIKMPPMEIVPIDNANFKGWAIVKAAE